jgi:hypothetical protein
MADNELEQARRTLSDAKDLAAVTERTLAGVRDIFAAVGAGGGQIDKAEVLLLAQRLEGYRRPLHAAIRAIELQERLDRELEQATAPPGVM